PLPSRGSLWQGPLALASAGFLFLDLWARRFTVAATLRSVACLVLRSRAHRSRLPSSSVSSRVSSSSHLCCSGCVPACSGWVLHDAREHLSLTICLVFTTLSAERVWLAGQW